MVPLNLNSTTIAEIYKFLFEHFWHEMDCIGNMLARYLVQDIRYLARGADVVKIVCYIAFAD